MHLEKEISQQNNDSKEKNNGKIFPDGNLVPRDYTLPIFFESFAEKYLYCVKNALDKFTENLGKANFGLVCTVGGKIQFLSYSYFCVSANSY